MSAAQQFGHVQAEAFCLMWYAPNPNRGSNYERIWNSRDGVTPFIISAKDNPKQEMQHVQWSADQYDPFHVPQVGDRIFVTATRENMHLLAVDFVDRFWDSEQGPPMNDSYATKEEAVEGMLQSWLGDGNQPTIVEVTPMMQEQFKKRVESGEVHLEVLAGLIGKTPKDKLAQVADLVDVLRVVPPAC